MLVVRRAHLYSGLALLPWVVLYGATALLFNHGTWWSASRAGELDRTQLAQGLRELPSAAEQADALVRGWGSTGGLRVLPGSARWIGGLQLSAAGRDASGDDVDVRLAIDPEGRGGSLRWSPRREAQERPPWSEVAGGRVRRELDDDVRASLVAAASAAARGRGLELDAVEVRRLPELEFEVVDGDASWTCSVAGDGKLEVARGDAPTDWRRRLLRLHVQHGDPGHSGARRTWGLIVDVVGAAMLLWGASGVAMWWSLRPTRRLGGLLLASGVLALAGMAAGLWAELGA